MHFTLPFLVNLLLCQWNLDSHQWLLFNICCLRSFDLVTKCCFFSTWYESGDICAICRKCFICYGWIL